MRAARRGAPERLVPVPGESDGVAEREVADLGDSGVHAGTLGLDEDVGPVAESSCSPSIDFTGNR